MRTATLALTLLAGSGACTRIEHRGAEPPPHAVTSAAATAATRRAWRRIGPDPPNLVEAPLGAGGTIALGWFPGARPAVLLIEPAGTRMPDLPLPPQDPGAIEARFADLDGDGRTDVLLRLGGLGYVGAYLTPRRGDGAMREDRASGLAMLGASSLAEAVPRARGVPVRGVPPSDACALLGRTRTLEGLRAVALSDARVLDFEEPDFPLLSPTVRPLSRLRGDSIRDSFLDHFRCADLHCDEARPFCTWADEIRGPYFETYWFDWGGGRLLLTAIARYVGT